MPFSSEQFIRTLKTLKDSEESIGSASRWLLAQYEDAPEIARTWKHYMLQEEQNSKRRLLAIYLVNHVSQQAKGKNITQFQDSFGPVLVTVLTAIYNDFPHDLKAKILRMVKIWKARSVFHNADLEAIERELSQRGNSTDGVNTKSSTSQSETKDEQHSTRIPSNLKNIISDFNTINKNKHNIPALKSRFDNVINELDPGSVVYEENFKTVAKIARVSTETINESIMCRKQIIDEMNKIIENEKKLLEQDTILLNDIEFSLNSKDPAHIKENMDISRGSSNHINSNEDGYDDTLPTYENNGDDNDDSDSDKDSDSDSDKNSDGDNNEVTVETEKNIDSNKRGINVVEYDEEQEDEPVKRTRPNTSEEYFVETGNNNQENMEDSNDSDGNNNVITSNIQDLLSRLAN